MAGENLNPYEQLTDQDAAVYETKGAGSRQISKADIEYTLKRVNNGDHSSHVWAGGFLGMNESKLGDLKTAIEKFEKDLQTIAEEFNPENDISMAFRGTVKDSVQEYIKAIKDLLKAYITIVNNSVKDADTAFANWKQQNSAISQTVSDESQDIRNKAESVKVG